MRLRKKVKFDWSNKLLKSLDLLKPLNSPYNNTTLFNNQVWRIN